MAVPAPAIPFFLQLANGQVWGAVEFPGGFVCVHHPDELNVCTIAVSVEALLADRAPGDLLYRATVQQYKR